MSLSFHSNYYAIVPSQISQSNFRAEIFWVVAEIQNSTKDQKSSVVDFIPRSWDQRAQTLKKRSKKRNKFTNKIFTQFT